MATNSPPSVILTDALASLNKAVNIAFSTIQDQARQEVSQATAEGRDARRERDDAIKSLHDSRLQEHAWKQDASVWKVAVEQAELTIKHHVDTIAQLRHEAEQWKQQCLRLEDTSRQEAISWKEQFLRVEQERYKLATRVDELMEEQLSYTAQTHASNTPITPMLRYPNATTTTIHTNPSTSTSSSSCLRRSPYVFHHPDHSMTASTSKATKPTSAQQLPTPISENRRATGEKPKQFIIRRVQAVIDVPVKEENMENTLSDQPLSVSRPSVSSSSPDSISTLPGPSRPPNSTIATKTIPIPSKTIGAPGKSGAGSATSKSTPANHKLISVNNKSASTSAKSAPGPSKSIIRSTKPTLSGTRNKPPSGPNINTPVSSSRPARKVSTKRQYAETEDEDEDVYRSVSDSNVEETDFSEEEDELMMGAEENRREVYGTKRIVVASNTKATPRAPPKKRKLVSSTTALTSGAGKKPPLNNVNG